MPATEHLKTTLAKQRLQIAELKKKLADTEKELAIANKRIENPNVCKHGSIGCIECEQRCECCGDDSGTMKVVHEQRLCENCQWDHDQGNFDCGCPMPEEKTG